MLEALVGDDGTSLQLSVIDRVFIAVNLYIFDLLLPIGLAHSKAIPADVF